MANLDTSPVKNLMLPPAAICSGALKSDIPGSEPPSSASARRSASSSCASRAARSSSRSLAALCLRVSLAVACGSSPSQSRTLCAAYARHSVRACPQASAWRESERAGAGAWMHLVRGRRSVVEGVDAPS